MWTPEMDAKLVEGYGRIPHSKLAELIGVASENSIRTRAAYLGFPPTRAQSMDIREPKPLRLSVDQLTVSRCRHKVGENFSGGAFYCGHFAPRDGLCMYHAQIRRPRD